MYISLFHANALLYVHNIVVYKYFSLFTKQYRFLYL